MYVRKNPRVTEGYKKMILGFVIVTVLLVGIILYFSAGRAVVKIVPKASAVETDFEAAVAVDGGSAGGQSLQGFLSDAEVAGDLEGEATGAEILGGNSIGKVTLINKRAEAQTLVKTTRLLAKDGILLRLSDKVVIPAGGQIEATVYADDPNAFKELPPTNFIIPGLWEGLQDKVYAESKSVLTSAGQAIKVVKEADIAKTKETLTEKLYEQAIADFKKQSSSSNQIILVVAKKVLEEKSSPAPETVGDKVTVFMKIGVTLIGLDQDKVIELAGERLRNAAPDGQELLNLDFDKFTYKVQNFDEQKKTATVKIHAAGRAVVQSDNEIFQKEKLTGLSPKGVELYLSNFDEVDSVSVELSPFWVKKVPSLKDHIDIVVVNPSK